MAVVAAAVPPERQEAAEVCPIQAGAWVAVAETVHTVEVQSPRVAEGVETVPAVPSAAEASSSLAVANLVSAWEAEAAASQEEEVDEIDA